MQRVMSSKFGRSVLSVWTWLVLGLTVIVMLPIVAVIRLVTAPFDPGAYRAGRVFRLTAVIIQKLNPMWKFTVTGHVPDDPRRPYVVVANHESMVDMLLISHVPMEAKWLAKSEFFKIPIFGLLMRLARDIRLDRGDKKSGVQALQDARERLDDKVSVMIFPEGTRSKTGELQEFQAGAFRLAIQVGVPILPLAVLGTRDALVKHDWRFGPSHAEVRILDPVPTDGMTKADVGELRDRVRAHIAATLDEMRAARVES